ncbi:hypothetical protein GYMLUDRAFT_253180 [Collybiopsis luxurians FD-317 M1]|uniref:Uncharacterized protein n=1 Tax=Collybiopsis luxurians FD-317 M1 TaxID=944289 RepID=A0A0D0BXK1_9AGAR|nr:hypothetical protein GYMLUDRAFT_253180 [Collybiopsis luxurians FD-317 M1]
MSNAQGQDQGQGGPPNIEVPPILPVRTAAEQASQQVTAGLRHILNQHQDGRIRVDAAKRTMLQYLTSYFALFNVCHNPQAMLQAWYGQINKHKRNLATAANEG